LAAAGRCLRVRPLSSVYSLLSPLSPSPRYRARMAASSTTPPAGEQRAEVGEADCLVAIGKYGKYGDVYLILKPQHIPFTFRRGAW